MNPLFSVTISAGVSVLIFIILHFVIEPRRQKIAIRKERLEKLYAPAYGLIVARLKLGKKLFSDKEMTLGGIKEHSYLTRNNLEEIIYNNLAYADGRLVAAWSEYTIVIGPIPTEVSDRLISCVVTEYNSLRKYLRLPYDKEELKTGIPEPYKHLRNTNGTS